MCIYVSCEVRKRRIGLFGKTIVYLKAQYKTIQQFEVLPCIFTVKNIKKHRDKNADQLAVHLLSKQNGRFFL